MVQKSQIHDRWNKHGYRTEERFHDESLEYPKLWVDDHISWRRSILELDTLGAHAVYCR